MLWNFSEAECYNVKDLYKQASDNNIKLLSDFVPNRLNGDWWEEYRNNYQKYDRVFRQKYASLIPLFQEDYNSLSDLLTGWRSDIQGWLQANEKRYFELWRIHTIPDDDKYSLTDNVNYTETYDGEEHTDIEFNKGQQKDSHEVDITIGQQIIEYDNSKTYGAHDIDTTNSRSSYNESGYSATDKSEIEDGAHTDTEDNSTTLGTHEDSRDTDITMGSRKDTTDNDYTKEYTLTKVGNYGTIEVDTLLGRHWRNWEDMFDFYGLIFSDIAKNYLRGA